jgi:DnaJ-class molecular chaperone
VQGSEVIAQKDVSKQIEGEMHQNRRCLGGSARQQARCRRCGDTGHNSRTCPKDKEVVVD